MVFTYFDEKTVNELRASATDTRKTTDEKVAALIEFLIKIFNPTEEEANAVGALYDRSVEQP